MLKHEFESPLTSGPTGPEEVDYLTAYDAAVSARSPEAIIAVLARMAEARVLDEAYINPSTADENEVFPVVEHENPRRSQSQSSVGKFERGL